MLSSVFYSTVSASQQVWAHYQCCNLLSVFVIINFEKKCSLLLCKLARQGFKIVLISRTLEKLETLAVELCKYWVLNFMDCFWALYVFRGLSHTNS